MLPCIHPTVWYSPPASTAALPTAQHIFVFALDSIYIKLTFI